MRLPLVASSLFGLSIWMSLACACSDKGAPQKATHADCAKVSDHIADLVMADHMADVDTLWDRAHEAGDPGIAEGVTKETFKAWLATPEGNTWSMQLRGQTLSTTQKGIDSCVANATKQDVTCLLAAKSKVDIDACDAAAERRTAAKGSGS